MKDSIAIVDFGSSKIVTLIGSEGINNTLTTLGKGEIFYAGFHNTNFIEPENLKFSIASSIANAEDASQQKITDVYIGVPGEFSAVVTKNITLKFPKVKRITPFDVENIYKTGNIFENEPNYCLINQSVIYYEIDGGQKVIDPLNFKAKQVTGKISYILALRSFVEIIKSIFYDLNIRINGFISSVLAESLYLFEPSLRDKYALLVDVGYLTTSVALSQGNGLIYLNSFSMGGCHVSSDLSQCLRIPFSEAEQLKNKIALAWIPSSKDVYSVETSDQVMKTYAAKAANEIALDRVELICSYIERCINLCKYEVPKFLPIYLAGGGISLMHGVRNIISQKLKRPVVRAVSKNLVDISPFSISEDGILSLILNSENSLNHLIVKH